MIDRRTNERHPRTDRPGRLKKLAPAALAAVTALGLPLVTLLGGATPAGAASDSAAYLTASVTSSPATAKILSSTPPNQATKVFNETGTRTGWIELWSRGSSGRTLRSAAPAPSGHGYVLGSAALDSTTIPSGAWAPRVGLQGRGNLTVVPMVRAFKLSAAGTYSLIGSSKGSRTALTATAVQVTLPTFTAAAVAWAPGDRLYLDLLAKVVVASSAAGNGVEHFENGGAAQSVTFPAPAPTVVPGPDADPDPDPDPDAVNPSVGRVAAGSGDVVAVADHRVRGSEAAGGDV